MLLFLECLLLLLASSAPLTIYVSTSGNDQTGTGDINTPYQTIARAQQEIRTYQPLTSPATVYIKGGVYRQTVPLVFGLQDSGNQANRITYTAQAETGEVQISGGIPITNWTQSPTNANIWVANVPANTPNPTQLWINGERRDMAHTDTMQYTSATSTNIIYKSGQLPQNKVPYNLADVDIVLFESWVASKHQISSIDISTMDITLKNTLDTQWLSASGSRYFLEGLVEALSEGEFYFNSTSRQIQYWTLAGENPSKSDMEVGFLNEIIRVNGNPSNNQYITDITFANLSFVYSTSEFSACWSSQCNGQSADFLTNATIHLIGASRWNFTNVVVGHTGGYGIWLDKGTFNNSISRSHLYDLGAGAIRIGMSSSTIASNQRSERNSVSDCILEDGSHVWFEGTALFGQTAAYTMVEHNSIHDFKYSGVTFGWSWGYGSSDSHDNIIQFNEIYNIGQKILSDMGCVYTLGVQPGTKILNNICYNVWSYDYGGWGLYTDEGSTNVTLTNNVVYDIKCAGFHQHYGIGNNIYNNIFSNVDIGECDTAIRIDPPSGSCDWASPTAEPCDSLTFKVNIIYLNQTTNAAGVGLNIVTGTNPNGFTNSTFTDNDYWIDNGDTGSLKFNGTTFTTWQNNGKDSGSILSDPLFVAPQKGDWWDLEPNSPAITKLGFVPIDVSTVGPRP